MFTAKATISCNSCGDRISGGYQNSDGLAVKNAIQKLREHEKSCESLKKEIKNISKKS